MLGKKRYEGEVGQDGYQEQLCGWLEGSGKMNNYQAQQLDNISSIIGFATSIMFFGFMVGMAKGLIGVPSTSRNPNGQRTISDYELTNKGKDYADYLFGIDMNRQQHLEFAALDTIDAQGLPMDYSLSSVEAILPSLEERGYISRIEIDIPTLIQRISDNTLRDHISIYYQIAQGVYLDDVVISNLHSDLRERVRKVAYLIPKSGRVRRTYNTCVTLLEEADTRPEKVMAIDATFGLQHYNISLVLPMYDTSYDDAKVVGRILGKLAKKG